MKNKYFTSETIDNKSQKMLQKLEKYRKRNQIDFLAERSALLILDMQKYFLDERSHACVPSALSIVPKIKKLADTFHDMNLPVFFTRHINIKENAKMMASWWEELLTEKNDLSEIISELEMKNSMIIKKTQYDGFYQTRLESILKEKKINQLVITGVMTHLCCETTARSAFVRGFTVFFPIDGTATYNENFHWGTLLNLSHGFAVPVLANDLQNKLKAFKNGQ
ncbi:MAG: hypothetical protein B6244_09920 [Candidatus Cloacimonetes bacterium 4572_55]|nr:MAG: hypothetical protein B6244_09920 [Candidatus Cloacimonetes bacterium 4572_55]